MPVDVAAACLMPHPPILVPEVGGAAVDRCRSTHEACVALAARLVSGHPDRLVVVTPHAPRFPRAAGVYGGTWVRGDLRAFGAPRTSIVLPNDPDLCERLLAAEQTMTTRRLDEPLDHGALVPLWFFAAAGWRGPTCVVGLPAYALPAEFERLGEGLGTALARQPGRTLLVASGDMSHRVTRDAPAGYHPRALEFDLACRDAIANGRLRSLGELDPGLREVAAEDVVDPVLVVSAVFGFDARRPSVLSYEHPFGVGYLVALLHDGGPPDGGEACRPVP